MLTRCLGEKLLLGKALGAGRGQGRGCSVLASPLPLAKLGSGWWQRGREGALGAGEGYRPPEMLSPIAPYGCSRARGAAAAPSPPLHHPPCEAALAPSSPRGGGINS